MISWINVLNYSINRKDETPNLAEVVLGQLRLHHIAKSHDNPLMMILLGDF